MLLFHLKSFFLLKILKFLYFSLPLIPPVSHCSRRWPKINLEVYVINCLKKNLKTYFVWYLDKEGSSDTETGSTDKVLNKEHFYGKKYAENMHQKVVTDFFLVLKNSPKQPRYILLKIRYFEGRLSKKSLKS